MEGVTGDTHYIYNFLDFGFYDHVTYKENAKLGMTAIGRWIEVSNRVGRLMSHWILNQKGTMISRTTVQRLASIEKETDKVKASVSEFDIEISCCFKEEEDLTYDVSKPNTKDWSEYLEYPDFQ